VAENGISANFKSWQNNRKNVPFPCGYDRKKGRLTGKKADLAVDTTGKKADLIPRRPCPEPIRDA